MAHDEELSNDEIVRLTEDKVDALIDLLVKKKVISEQELSQSMDALYSESGADDDDEKVDDEE